MYWNEGKTAALFVRSELLKKLDMQWSKEQGLLVGKKRESGTNQWKFRLMGESGAN